MLLGKDAKLYIGEAGTPGDDLGDLEEFSNVRDLSLPMDSNTWDGATRAHGSWNRDVPTTKGIQVQFNCNADPDDAILAALLQHWREHTVLRAAVMTGDRDIDGTTGPLGDWRVANISRGEPRTEGITYDITLTLEEFIDWAEGETPDP